MHFNAQTIFQVAYNIQGWLDKNKDPIQECVIELMQNSKEALVSSFFKEPENGECGKFKKLNKSLLITGLKSNKKLYIINFDILKMEQRKRKKDLHTKPFQPPIE